MCCATLICTLVEPPYTTDKPDTSENQKGFEVHFGFPPPADVTELYYYADTLGIDGTYQLGFKAEPATIEKIITENSLQPADDCPPPTFAVEFTWWKNADLEALESCWVGGVEGKTATYLWYDEKTRQAWYLDYDL